MTLTRTHLTIAVLAIVAFAAAFAVGRAVWQPTPTPETAAARTSFPDLEPAASEPQLSSLSALRPAPGEILQAPGPFDDRFVLTDLRLEAGTLSGSAQITSDVSELLEFEAVAAFYDAQGLLLGTGRFVHHLDEGSGHEEGGGPPNEVETFTITVPPEAQGAVAATVGVPVLVNE